MKTFNEFINEAFNGFEDPEELKNCLRKNGEDYKFKIDPRVGGGKGIFVEFGPSEKFVIMKVKGKQLSYHLSDIGM